MLNAEGCAELERRAEDGLTEVLDKALLLRFTLLLALLPYLLPRINERCFDRHLALLFLLALPFPALGIFIPFPDMAIIFLEMSGVSAIRPGRLHIIRLG